MHKRSVRREIILFLHEVLHDDADENEAVRLKQQHQTKGTSTTGNVHASPNWVAPKLVSPSRSGEPGHNKIWCSTWVTIWNYWVEHLGTQEWY